MSKKRVIPDDAPETIYLQWLGEDAAEALEPLPKFKDGAEVYWCSDSIFDTDLEYRLVRRKS